MHLSELTFDPRNARKHNPRNIGMIAESLQQFGPARSIAINPENVILAGNGVAEAAAQIGVEHVRVYDRATGILEPEPPDGAPYIFAVRISGLTPEQETLYALADNRTTDLSEFDADMLQAFMEDGIDLDQFWFPEELDRVLSGLPGDDQWGDAFGSLPDGDKSPFQQMTFTVSDEQAEQVSAALTAAKQVGPFVDTGNENSNGNALARICETYLTRGAA